jgi:Na+/H+ antiporter NhaD/arsenite permease-like protein
MAGCIVLVSFGATASGYTLHQTVSIAVFTMLVAGTALYWNFHLVFAFLGVSVIIVTNILNLPELAGETKLDIIIFLMGMMFIVGILKDVGLFSWVITGILSSPRLTALRFILMTCFSGTVMSCLIDETAAVVFAAALVFQVTDALDIKPFPFLFMTVVAINIGSAGAMIGNPVSILIGQNARPPLSFNDFMLWSFPLTLVEFAVVFAFLCCLFRKEIRTMDGKMTRRRESGRTLAPMIRVPHRRGILILVALLLCLVFHTVIERRLGLQPNTMLITTPLFIAAILLIWRREHLHRYLQHDVDWGVIAFLMMLFMIAGALERTGATQRMAQTFSGFFGEELPVLIPAVVGISALGSAFVENIVFVAAFTPVITHLEETPLLWALLHGSCLGGNITMIGSTANIVVIGMLEKRYWTKVRFREWFKTGVLVGIISCAVAWCGITLLAPYMPTHRQRMENYTQGAGHAAPTETPQTAEPSLHSLRGK